VWKLKLSSRCLATETQKIRNHAADSTVIVPDHRPTGLNLPAPLIKDPAENQKPKKKPAEKNPAWTWLCGPLQSFPRQGRPPGPEAARPPTASRTTHSAHAGVEALSSTLKTLFRRASSFSNLPVEPQCRT